MYKVGDIVIVKDLKGNKYKGEIININDYREPRMKYAVDIDGFNDYVFIGENQIVEKIN